MLETYKAMQVSSFAGNCKITTTLEKYRVLMTGSISKGLLEEVIFEVILYTLAWFFEDNRHIGNGGDNSSKSLVAEKRMSEKLVSVTIFMASSNCWVVPFN